MHGGDTRVTVADRTALDDGSGLERYRGELTGYCYRMLGSPFEAEDAVQEALTRAWRGRRRLADPAALRGWLYRIATNVCIDMRAAGARRAMPMDLSSAGSPAGPVGGVLGGEAWVEPVPDALVVSGGDPGAVAEARESLRLAFIAALQHLPPRQRAVLILREVLSWRANEVADLLDTSVASVNSALQRARATLAARDAGDAPADPGDDARRRLLDRYLAAFEAYDMEALTRLIHEDATQSMPPYRLWLRGRDDILAWWVGPGAGCRGSRLVPTSANGSPAFGQYRPSRSGDGHDPWSLQVLRLDGTGIAEMTFFLDTDRLFPLFGLPAHLPPG